MTDLPSLTLYELRRANDTRERIAAALERIANALDPVESVSIGPESTARDLRLIEELELGVRAYNALRRHGYRTLGELRATEDARLLAIPNFGKKSLSEVREAIAAATLRSVDDHQED